MDGYTLLCQDEFFLCDDILPCSDVTLALVSAIIALKMNESETPPLSFVLRGFEDQNIQMTMEELRKIEIAVLHRIDFQLTFESPHTFVLSFLLDLVECLGFSVALRNAIWNNVHSMLTLACYDPMIFT
ncbi:unnamed protein product, partial [marine sediment metagenome]